MLVLVRLTVAVQRYAPTRARVIPGRFRILKGMAQTHTIRVRAATVDDVPFLVEGNARMALETESLHLDRERLRRGVEAVFADPGRGFYVIAEVDGAAAGQMMITYEWSDWRNGVFWWIQSVYTVPEYRGRGAFKALYAAVEEMARERGDVCGLRLYVEAHNEAAQATYRRCGMNETIYRMFEVDGVLARGPETAEKVSPGGGAV